jgi:hypothetical protein
MLIDHVEDVAEELIGIVVGTGRTGSRDADEDRAFQGGEEGKLSLRAGAHGGPEMVQVGVLVEDGEERIQHFLALPVGKLGDEVFLWHFASPD